MSPVRATAEESEMNSIAYIYLRGVTPRVFNFSTNYNFVTYTYSGAVAFGAYGSPFVSRVRLDSRRHEWIYATYSGICMVRASSSDLLLAFLLLEMEVSSVNLT